MVLKILDYQFGKGVSEKLKEKFKEIKIEYSKKTGRARRIWINNKLFGTIEATTGFIIPTFWGGLTLKEILEFPKYRVVIKDEAVPFVSRGKSVFCKFVEYAYEEILPKDIVLVVDKNDNLIAVGEAVLSAKEMKEMKRGIAVKPKHWKNSI